MKTERLILEKKTRKERIERAAHLLKKGEVVAIPTETVYGLAADATNEEAVAKIFRAKGRPADNPLIVHVASKEDLLRLIKEVPPYVEKLIDTFSPGPMTYVLKSDANVATNVSAGLSTIGVRIPNNETALELLRVVGLPLAAPSANLSGKPSPTTADHVMQDLSGKIAAVLDDGPTTIGIESTVVDCTREIPVILRLGMITEEEIRQVVGRVEVASHVTEGPPPSPGMKYTHYAPDVPLVLVKNREKLREIISEKRATGARVGVIVSTISPEKVIAEKIVSLGENEKEATRNLYRLLRSFDAANVDVVICEAPTSTNETAAILDRLERAATKVVS